MANGRPGTAAMADRLEQIHERRLDAQSKRKLRPLLGDMDRLPRRDAEGAVYVDRAELERWLRKHARDQVSPGFMSAIESLPGGELVREPERARAAGDQRISWDEFMQEVAGAEPADSFEQLGLSRDATPEQVRAAVEREIGTLPDELFDPERAPGLLQAGLAAATEPPRDAAEGAQRHGPDANALWNCLFGQLPWWASIAFLLAIVVIVGTLVISGGTFAAALALGMETFFGIFGVGALYSFVICFVTHILTPMFPH